MKTLIHAAIRCSLMFTAVAALSIAYPAPVQAVPTTYRYTGNPFTQVSGPYTTSDFVTAMVTLAGPLGANMSLTEVTPIAFTLSDGVQTIRFRDADFAEFSFATDSSGAISAWLIDVGGGSGAGGIFTTHDAPETFDEGFLIISKNIYFGENRNAQGGWTKSAASVVPDAGSTLSLMTLTLMALGVAARQFKRGAA